MRTIALLVTVVLLAGCNQVPAYRRPQVTSNNQAEYYVPRCDEVGSNTTIPCRHVVTTPPPSACEKRFKNKALCEPVSANRSASTPVQP